MTDNNIYKDVFRELKIIMRCYEKTQVCTDNEENIYALYTKHIMKNKKPLYFGSVQINKAYIGYHLMGCGFIKLSVLCERSVVNGF